MKANYYMIVNTGTLIYSAVARAYPYHLTLSQLWHSNDAYKDMLLRMKKRGVRIILDNGAHEGTVEIDEAYRECVKELKPNVVVLPDLIGDKALDSRLTSMAFASWVQNAFPTMEMMYAAQGASQEDILNEYCWAYDRLDPNKFIIGYGQSYLTFEDNDTERIHEKARQFLMEELLSMLAAKGLMGRVLRMRGHVLGARWEPQNLKRYFELLNIVGLDTIKPCTSAGQGLYYPVHLPNQKVDRYSLQKVDEGLLVENVKRLTEHYGLEPVPTDWA